MNLQYLFIPTFFLVLGILSIYCPFVTSIVENHDLEKTILSVGVFATMAASVMPLSPTEPKKEMPRLLRKPYMMITTKRSFHLTEKENPGPLRSLGRNNEES